MQEQAERLRIIRGSCRTIRGFLWIGLGGMALFAALYICYGVKAAKAPVSSYRVTESRYGTLSIDIAGQDWRVGSIVPDYATPMGVYADYSPKTLQFVNMALSLVLVLAPVTFIMMLVLLIIKRVMKGSSPFCGENIRCLKFIGWIMLFRGLAVKILYLLGIVYLVFGGQVRGTSYLFDVGEAFSGGLLLVLARIFEYGAYLQHEYDTTL